VTHPRHGRLAPFCSARHYMKNNNLQIKTTIKDHVITAIKAVCASISIPPGISLGGIPILIDEYIGNSTKKALDKAIEYFSEKIKELEGRIDILSVNQDEFSDTIKQFGRVILYNSKEEKLRAAANLLANAMLKTEDPDKISYAELDHTFKCVESLSIGAIQLLGTIYEKEVPQNQRHHTNKNYRLNFDDISRYFPEYEPTFLMGLVGECNAYNLLHILGIPQIKTNEYGNYPIELTRFGQRFIKTIMNK